MIGIGTLVNAGAIIAGSLLGVLLKGGIPKRINNIIYQMVGVAVIFIGIIGVVNNQGNSMLLVLSLVIGGVIGELLKIEDRMEVLGEKRRKLWQHQQLMLMNVQLVAHVWTLVQLAF